MACFRDEAARIWEKREAEWARERKARERLMQEVRTDQRNPIPILKLRQAFVDISVYLNLAQFSQSLVAAY